MIIHRGSSTLLLLLLLFLSHTVLVRDRQARTVSTKEPTTVFFTLFFGNFLGMNNGIESLRRFCDRACVSAHMYVFKSVLDTHTHTHTHTRIQARTPRWEVQGDGYNMRLGVME